MQPPDMQPPRNTVAGFADRTRKNLEHIRKTFDDKKAIGQDQDPGVHVVTQVVTSLLGLVVVPRERLCREDHPAIWNKIARYRLADLTRQCWPTWTILLEDPRKETTTLGRLMRHVRNAISHGRFRFLSDSDPDSPNLSEITLVVEDVKSGCVDPYWQAEIAGEDLYKFCLQLAQRIADTADGN